MSRNKAINKAIDLSGEFDEVVLVVRYMDDFGVYFDSEFQGDYEDVVCAFFHGEPTP